MKMAILPACLCQAQKKRQNYSGVPVSSHVLKIVEILDNLSSRTDLLAINTAIEAAHAGIHKSLLFMYRSKSLTFAY